MTDRQGAPSNDPGFDARFFRPADHGAARPLPGGIVELRLGPDLVYQYSPRVVLAVNLAIATCRPLLLLGSPGSGKSTLARNVAACLGWRCYARTVGSQTRARDLLWTFDALQRLSDAQASVRRDLLRPRAAYVEPQLMWWAFDRDSARRRGAREGAAGIPPAVDPQVGNERPEAVVLVDEIDKADPDVPNDLLEVLDQQRFEVDSFDPPLPVRGDRRAVLLVITSNGERDLPAAFVRRCVQLELESPTVERLVAMADERHPGGSPMHEWLAHRLDEMRALAKRLRQREPSTAEYLDAVAACHALGIDDPLSAAWQQLEQALLWKRDQPPLPPIGAPG